ncbi:DEAD-domain-containing protein [Marasmius fiardii PR-910]|nr:DEAD-domain-containing protein [Marasmius fiardii PR-910]
MLTLSLQAVVAGSRSFSLRTVSYTGRSITSTQCRRSAFTSAKTTAPRVKTSGSPVASEKAATDYIPTPFASIRNAISPGTYTAITVRPYDFQDMTEVQAAVLEMLPDLALPHGVAKGPRDIMVRARTGTGKTLSFLVPAIEARLNVLQALGEKVLKDNGLVNDPELKERAKRVFAREQVGTLILTPTRELAAQIADEALNLTKHHPDLNVHVWVGAASKRIQMRDFMKKSRDIVVATPGRLRDLLESEPDVQRGLSHTHQVIFDEADTMLEIGFRDDIEAIMKHLPRTPERQTFLFSATLPPKVRAIAGKYLDMDHTFIDRIKDEDSPVHADIPQYHTVVPSASQQIPHILRLIAHDQLVNPGSSKIIVFLPTTKMTQLLTTILVHFGQSILPSGKRTKVMEIHSKRPQHFRTQISDAFKNDKSGASILVSSDVSARGVDYPLVTRVIQVGIPSNRSQYVHRVGRTGRGLKQVQGRGDLVLLPWEVGFISWQLTDIPIKPVTVTEMKTQLATLAENYDKAPTEYFPVTKKASREAIRQFQNPFTPYLDEFDRIASELGPRLDPEAIRETFLSLLGYYLSKSAELRISNEVILEGCKQWVTDALGQETPPYVSELFLRKLGFSDHRTKHFGRPALPGRYSSTGGQHWIRRGTQKNKTQVPKVYETNIPDEEADQYRTPRYNLGRTRVKPSPFLRPTPEYV